MIFIWITLSMPVILYYSLTMDCNTNFYYMIKILRIIDANPEFKPGSLDEKTKVEDMIAMGMINPIGSETRDEYIALLLTRQGREYLRKFSR